MSHQNGTDLKEPSLNVTHAGSSAAHPELTMFYDSRCPLCVSEVKQLQALDKPGRLGFVDIHHPQFSTDWPDIDPVQADRVLHALRADGTMLYGLDVSAEIWSMVGRHRWLKLLRLPVVRVFTDLGYRIFARYRYGISYLLTGQRRCDICYTDTCVPGQAGSTNRKESPRSG